jgi:hypothetical protein
MNFVPLTAASTVAAVSGSSIAQFGGTSSRSGRCSTRSLQRGAPIVKIDTAAAVPAGVEKLNA